MHLDLRIATYQSKIPFTTIYYKAIINQMELKFPLNYTTKIKDFISSTHENAKSSSWFYPIAFVMEG